MKELRRKKTPESRGYTQDVLRTTPIGKGLPSIFDMRAELDGYMDVLLGWSPSPVVGDHALQEVADAYYARASDIARLIQRGEADGDIKKGSPLYLFRNGELRTFCTIAEKAASLGSRRITARNMEVERSRLGRDSAR